MQQKLIKTAILKPIFCVISFLILFGCATNKRPITINPSYNVVTTLEDRKVYENLLQFLEKKRMDINAKETSYYLEKKKKCIKCLEDRLFVLDDMANIYTVGLVNFEKALELNKEAFNTYNEIMGIGIENIPVPTDYFNTRRRLYLFAYYDESQQPAKSKEANENLEEKDDPLVLPFSKIFLNYVRKTDLDSVKNLISDRFTFLNEKLGIASEEKTLQKENCAYNIGQNLLQKREEIQLLLANNYEKSLCYLDYYQAQKAWSIYITTGSDDDLKNVLSSSTKALNSKVKFESNNEYELLAYLNYWYGFSLIRTGNFQEGISHLEEFVHLIELNEKKTLERQERIQTAFKSLQQREKNKAAALLAMGIVMTAGLSFAGGYLSAPMYNPYATPSQAMTAQLSSTGMSVLSSTVSGVTSTSYDSWVKGHLSLKENLRDLTKYQSLYAIKLNRFLNRHEQLLYFIEIGKAYKESGQLEKAIEHYKEAIHIIENQRGTIATEAQRIGFLRDREGVYKILISLLVKTGKFEEAFEYVERAKSRAFIELLGSTRLVLRTKDETDAYRNLQKQRSEIDVMLSQKDVSTAQYMNIATRDSKERGLRVEGKETNIEFTSLSNVKTLTYHEVSELIDRDNSIIEYFIADNELIIFVVGKEKIDAISVKINNDELFQRLKDFRDTIIQGSANRGMKPSAKNNDPGEDIKIVANKLYKSLFEPVSHLIAQNNLYIVPHGPLHYIPFQSLHDGNEYLINKYSFSYLPSATVLKFVMEKKKSNERNDKVLIFANPDLGDPKFDLPYAQKEAEFIREGYPASQIFFRIEARETRVKELCNQYGILHFATHGNFDVSDPFEAALILVPDENNDGMLKLSEVFSMSLNADMVVLSACQTGLSKVSSGDELIGLTRGFIYAGSPTIVASLWRVDDISTAYLMKNFYENLKTMSKTEALQKAQVETMSKYSHPFYWAPFVLIGYSK